MYYKYYLPFLFQETTSIFTKSIFFNIVLLNAPFPYVGVSVCTVTHKQRLEIKDLQEKTITALFVQKLGMQNKKRRVKLYFDCFFVLTSGKFEYYR
jgi:hypothetical protein